jgi:hypothetical protein
MQAVKGDALVGGVLIAAGHQTRDYGGQSLSSNRFSHSFLFLDSCL